ncbi:MAG: hypothetical protein M3O15_10400, partial [Acidobacteriota bacterium]|nr:hypothetical protein [Acidobacteriota bacterium]
MAANGWSARGGWRRVGLALMVGFALWPSRPVAAQLVQLDPILTKLEDDDFATRQQGSADLKAALTGNKLSAADLNKLRQVCQGMGKGTDPEVRLRASRELKPLIAKLPAITTIRTKSDFYEGVTPAGGVTPFLLGEMDGQISPLNPVEVADYAKLKKLVEGLRQDVELGDTVAAKAKLTGVQKFINGLPAGRFNDLFFRKNMVMQTQAQVSAMIQQAIDQIGNADTQINKAIGPPPPPGPRPKVPVPGPGKAPTGLSFDLELANVVASGTVDLSFDSPEAFDVDSVPPPGYQFIGQVVSLIPDDAVLVSGQVTVGIEYSLTDGTIPNPSALRMVRVANGQIEFLATTLNDLGTGELFAAYTTDPSQAEQFGLFGLVLATATGPGSPPPLSPRAGQAASGSPP